MIRLLPLPLYPAVSPDWYGMFADTNDQELIMRIDGDIEGWFWWTTSS